MSITEQFNEFFEDYLPESIKTVRGSGYEIYYVGFPTTDKILILKDGKIFFKSSGESFIFYHENSTEYREYNNDKFRLTTMVDCKTIVKKLKECSELKEIRNLNGDIIRKINPFDRVISDYTYYQDSSDVLSITFFQNTLKIKYIEYYKNGSIKKVYNFNEGIKEGTCKEFYKNGSASFCGEYKNGYLDGDVSTYFDNGEKSTFEIYLKGELLTKIRYNSDGDVMYKMVDGNVLIDFD